VFTAENWLELACGHLDVELQEVAGRGRHPDVVTAREVIGLVGVERFGVRVTDLAEALGKSRDGVSKWMRRGAERRTNDPEFAALAESLDAEACEEP
jgi:hypothetical protein